MKAQVTELKDLVVPVGTVVAGVRIAIFGAEGGPLAQADVPAVDGVIAGAAISADITVPGTYHAVAFAISPAGDAIGDSVTSNALTIEAPTTITVQVPGVLSLSA